MKRLFLAGLLASTTLAGAQAANVDFDSGISAVTVFPRGAQVTRSAAGDVEAGEHTIIIDDLPGHIDAASVRVEGTAAAGLSIGSIDVRSEVVSPDDDPAERKRLEAELAALRDEAGRLDQTLQDIGSQRQMLQALITGSVLPRGEEGPAALEAEDLAGILDVASQRMAALTDQTVSTQRARRDVEEDIQTVVAQLNRLAPTGETRTVIAINVNAGEATGARFDVRYNVAEAGWNAIYDAELDLADGVENLELAITRRAEVRQWTTEAWRDVALTLSTARPTAATQAPVLFPIILDELPEIAVEPLAMAPQRSRKMAEADAEFADGIAGSAEMAADAPVVEQSAQMNTGGFQATYTIAGATSVENDQQSKSVLIGSDSQRAGLVAVSVPSVDPAAYLQAEFTLAGEATYLPGPVLLTRNGAFLGRGAMPLLAPGESHELGFGADDFIKVERLELDRSKGESGLLSTVNTDETRFRIRVENLHDFAMPVRVIDQLPVSDNEAITVARLPGTEPDLTDLDGQRGVLAWERNAAAGSETEIDFGYRVTWPGEMEISGLR